MEPMLTLLITFPVGLLILGPIGAVLGEVLMQIFAAIDASVPFLVPMIVGAVSPFLVFVGMHRAVGTLETMQIAQMGFSSAVRHRHVGKQHRAGSVHTGAVIEVEG